MATRTSSSGMSGAQRAAASRISTSGRSGGAIANTRAAAPVSTSGRSGGAIANTRAAAPVSTSGRSGAATASASRQGRTPGAQNPAAFPPPPSSDSGTDTGTGDGFSVDSGPVVPAAPVWSQNYLENDLTYQLQKAALDNAMQAYTANLGAQRERYNVDYGNALRKLGFTGDNKMLDTAKWDPNTNKWANAGVDVAPTWNMTDETTASGRGFSNALNDFAARGMLQSTAYGRAVNNLARSLNEQLASTASARNQQNADWDAEEAAKRAENINALGQLNNESTQRIKAALGIA